MSAGEQLLNPTETLRQFTERCVREIATKYGLTQVEVRGLYDWRAAWVRAVAATAEAGGVLSKRTLDALDRYDRYLIMHNHPSAIPQGYVSKDARSALSAPEIPADAEEALDGTGETEEGSDG